VRASDLDAIKPTFKALFLIGTLILLFGFVLVWIPQAGISGLNQQLSHASLNSEKVGLERVISVESLNLVTFYQPMSNILEAVGSIVIGYSILTTTFSIALKDRSKVQFQQDVSQFESLKFYPKLGYEKVAALSQET
jgi:hypothetical protein